MLLICVSWFLLTIKQSMLFSGKIGGCVKVYNIQALTSSGIGNVYRLNHNFLNYDYHAPNGLKYFQLYSFSLSLVSAYLLCLAIS